MPNIFAALTAIPDRPPTRAADSDQRSEQNADAGSFNDAFDQGAAARERISGGRAESRDDAKQDNIAADSADASDKKTEPTRRGGAGAQTPHAKSAAQEKFQTASANVDAPILEAEAASPALLATQAEAVVSAEVSTSIDGSSRDLKDVDGAAVLETAPAALPADDPAAVALAVQTQAPIVDVPGAQIALGSADVAQGLESATTETSDDLRPIATSSGPGAAQAFLERGTPIAPATNAADSTDAQFVEIRDDPDRLEEAPASQTLVGGSEPPPDGTSPINVAPEATRAALSKSKSKNGAAREHNLDFGLDAQPALDRSAHQTTSHLLSETRGGVVGSAAASASAAAQVIAAIRTEKGSNEIDVRLDPPELGRVKISLTFERSDIVTATVSSERPDTLDLLRRHQDELARELERAGFSKVRLDFSANDSGRAFSDQPPRGERIFGDGVYSSEAIEDVHVHYLSLRTDNRLDRLV